LVTVLSNCNIVELEKGAILENASITLNGERISGISENNSGRKSPSKEIDMEGAYVLPGLVSLHNHFSIVFPFRDTDLNESPAITALRAYKRAQDDLNGGVTTVRSTGEIHRIDLELRKVISSKWVKGPRILAGGKGLGVTGGHGAGLGQVDCDGPDEFRKAGRHELSLGADHLKIFITGGIAKEEEAFGEPQMTQEEIAAVTSVAASKGTYVTAHAGGSGPIMAAIEAGVKCFEHAYLLNDEAATMMKENNCVLVPTLGVTRSPVWMKEHNFEEWTIQKAVSAGDTHLQSIRNAVRAGVRILNGTDIPPGDWNDGAPAAIREVEFMMDAGLNSADALRASTIYPAQLCNVGDKIGLVKPGYYADLIATQQNPLKEIRALRKITFVMKDGEVVRDDEGFAK
jgi:imidazolonepropionase-like amidohydrolase